VAESGNGVNYQIVTQTPIYRIDSLQALARTPITRRKATPRNCWATWRASGAISRRSSSTTTTFSRCSTSTRTWTSATSAAWRARSQDHGRHEEDAAQDGTTLELRGEVKTMNDSFTRLGIGIIFAIMLVYLLMAVNFQSWLDPLIILMAIPCAFCGILWMLFLTQTTFNVPSLMGAIMTIGVATANSILMVVFANDERLAGKDRARPR
jgi:multidrug efflux pump subunit AcrB